ncbi:DUF1553 domain-containing protein [Catalinimonas niigatensis]|uniref:DUF1553 domain-containing protein n=1 Tax=Catalinimonas niigatensis TaxID=1397264 RepID=UPI00266666D4|nr:DUF1553 domain-containing protein [Catalinimonas niigatensis]WPP49217.1 DUF1553 domain-containing protein [Catalinimonas niigatensis]
MKSNYLTKKKIGILISLGVLVFVTYWMLHAFSNDSQRVDFNAEIRPILNKKCITCHGGVKRSAEFSLLFRTEALGVNESGKRAIVPGNVAESEMIHRIKHDDPEMRMPPEGDPLSKEEIDLLTQWIEEGAQWEDHWAYVKPEPVELPETDTDWGHNEIDRFVLERLEQENLQPSAPADKAILLRRLSLDLIGLPPTEEELNHFLANTSADAYEQEVDRLLASPRYGERWTAMWMDLARYADSKGYEADRERSIWQYRDWLIKAFNEDKPFDQFTIEQLAGDLLPNPTDEQRIATAFHRNTMNNDEGGTDDEEFRVAAVIDRVNTTWDIWQATTMACVQCHSHPYDPIRHEDYYKSYAFFNNSADEDVASESPNLKTFKHEEDRQSLEEVKNWVIEHTASADLKLEKAQQVVNLVKITEPKIHGHSFDQIQKGTLDGYKRLTVEDGGHNRIPDVPLNETNQMMIHYQAGQSGTQVEIRLDSLDGPLLTTWNIQKTEGFETIALPVRPVAGRHDLYLKFKAPGREGYLCTIEWVLFNEALPGENHPGYAQTRKQLFSLLNNPEVIQTPVMFEKAEDYRRNTHVFERGNWMVHGEEVQPGVPQAWNDMPEGAPDNRLGFAQWLVNKDNPLTARVTVNRFWAQLFGTGIIETIEDFGTQGFAPSHPELLDWLAQQFMYEHGWSIKKMLKQMVMSATYQQSSKATQELLAIDPGNRLLARGPRVRLNAEQVRDQALAISGLLSDKMYGPSVMPLQPEGIWQVVYNGLEWKTSEGEDQYRRALYTYWRRTSPYPSMIAFDGPSREFCVTRRIDTNTPLQALVTLNDPVYMEAAHALAKRMQPAGQVEEQIKKGYTLATLREIDAEKLHELQKLYAETLLHFEAQPEAVEKIAGQNDIQLAVLTMVANVILNLDEFITKS